MFDNIAIIAGSGNLPFKIATYLKKLNSKFIVLSIKGFSNISLYKNFKSYSLRMGEGSKAIKILKENNIKKIIFLGALDRPGLYDLKPDQLLTHYGGVSFANVCFPLIKHYLKESKTEINRNGYWKPYDRSDSTTAKRRGEFARNHTGFSVKRSSSSSARTFTFEYFRK